MLQKTFIRLVLVILLTFSIIALFIVLGNNQHQQNNELVKSDEAPHLPPNMDYLNWSSLGSTILSGN